MPANATTYDEVFKAVSVLRRSERGRQVMSDTLKMLDDGGMALDQFGKHALLILLTAAFGNYPEMARDEMRNALNEDS